MKKIKIGNRTIGEKESVFVIAEAGVNHNGSLEKAKELIVKAVNAGADAIKFQTYKAEKLVTKTAPRFWNWGGEEKLNGTQYDSYSKLDGLSLDFYPELVKLCKKNDIVFLSTPFDEEAVDFLKDIGMPAFKIASCDITNLPFLKHIAKKSLPIILSTGCSTIGEIEEAITVISDAGNEDIILLHCVLSYPTKEKDINLNMMRSMQKIFGDIPVGLSDHSIGTTIPIAAVALGAKVIEKHYTLDKKLMLSADHWLSVNPEELTKLVKEIRIVEAAMGSYKKEPVQSEMEARKYARRSIVAGVSIPKGKGITRDMLVMKRPGTGISPKFLEVVIGKTAKRDIEGDTLISWEDIC